MTEPIADEVSQPEPIPDEVSEPEPDADDDAVRKLKRECQQLRSRLRDTEEQIGAAAAREAVHQRAVIEHAAKAAGLIDGSDLLSVHDPSEFIDQEFADVVPDRVAEATKALLAQKPYLGRLVGPPPSDRPVEGLRSGARAPEDRQPTSTWYGALHG